MSKIITYLGPMYARKSTRLLAEVEKYLLSEKKVLLVKSNWDTRYNEKVFTHNSVLFDSATPIAENKYLTMRRVEMLSEIADTNQYDLIAIDEGQQFRDIYETLLYWRNTNVCAVIIVTGLDTDYNRVIFPEIAKLLGISDYFEKLNGICMVCKKSPSIWSKIRETPSESPDNTRIIGGKELFLAVCSHCYLIE